MRAVGLHRYLPVSDTESFVLEDVPTPVAAGHDLLVRVHAVSVNPVDTKVRAPRPEIEESLRILGWDAAGVVEAVGPAVTRFAPGDHVYYAGSITRPGSNAEYQLVDERIVGRKPANLSFAEAAALPLTTITAWEALFDRMRIPRDPAANSGKTILIIGGAGGVGSIAIQIARRVAGLNVIATASRPESVDWCRSLGASAIIDHTQPFRPQLEALGLPHVAAIFCLNSTEQHFAAMADCIAPQGVICTIVETKNDAPLPMNLLQGKSASFVWELMFTRPIFQTPDMDAQHALLNEVAGLIETGVLQTTLTDVVGPLAPETLREAHRQLESGRTIGKVALTGIA